MLLLPTIFINTMYKKGGDKHCPESMKLREKMEKKYREDDQHAKPRHGVATREASKYADLKYTQNKLKNKYIYDRKKQRNNDINKQINNNEQTKKY